MFIDPNDQEMDLDLDNFLERDEKGAPFRLILEFPFTVQMRKDGRKEDVEVGVFQFRRPSAEALDILGRMASDRKNPFPFMREFIAKLVHVPDEPDLRIETRHIAASVDSLDFYRAWASAQDFLPKPKRKGENPLSASGD